MVNPNTQKERSNDLMTDPELHVDKRSTAWKLQSEMRRRSYRSASKADVLNTAILALEKVLDADMRLVKVKLLRAAS